MKPRSQDGVFVFQGVGKLVIRLVRDQETASSTLAFLTTWCLKH
jgi:hypothetical protein